jgi:hypothetical protein
MIDEIQYMTEYIFDDKEKKIKGHIIFQVHFMVWLSSK